MDIPKRGNIQAPYIGEWLSPAEHLLWEQGVAGSNPASPTIKNKGLRQIGVNLFYNESYPHLSKIVFSNRYNDTVHL